MIAIVDYGIGNVGSIQNMLFKVGENEVILAHTPEDVKKAEKLILPGVGAYDMGMSLLNQSGMREEIDRQVLGNKKPILGICLGMQMLGTKSEEGEMEGLGYIPFKCKKFEFPRLDLKVPHMGWDYVEIQRPGDAIVNGIGKGARYYFVHSFYAVCDFETDVLMRCDYGERFVAAVHRENIYGMQFHPEKSHKYGMKLFENFVKEI